MKRKVQGYLNGAIASISYGTNPLFALPLFSLDIGVNSVLFYRYVFAVIIYGLWLKFFKKISFKLNFREFFSLLILGLFFSLSSLTLFGSFNYIEAGIACTILFIYPIIVALMMAAFFKEKVTKTTISTIFLTSCGIILLYGGKNDSALNLQGVFLVLMSALFYALYIVGVKKIKHVKHIKPDKLNFYVMLFGLLVYVVNLKFLSELQILDKPFEWICVIALGIIPTIISLETLTIAIKFIGSTKTAVLGALEPLTALFFGILLFGEVLTFKIALGVLLIIFGVVRMIICK